MLPDVECIKIVVEILEALKLGDFIIKVSTCEFNRILLVQSKRLTGDVAVLFLDTIHVLTIKFSIKV